MPIALINLALALALLGRAPDPPPASAPASPPPAVAAGADEGPDAGADATATGAETTDPDVIALLDRLEASAADLRSFTADVVYEAEDALIGNRERRRGTLIYQASPEDDARRFAVLFDRFERNRRLETRLKHYVFDGVWLAEIDHELRQFNKYQVVAPGERRDPLALGEGPFPLPVGQPREQVLRRFAASRLEIPQEGPLARVPASYPSLEGLLLVPRPGRPEAETYERIELLYDTATLLPVGIHVVKQGGDLQTVRLSNTRRNPELDEADLQKLEIDEPDRGSWSVHVRPWRDGGG